MYQIMFWLLTSLCSVVIVGIALLTDGIDDFTFWLFITSGSFIFIVAQSAILMMVDMLNHKYHLLKRRKESNDQHHVELLRKYKYII